MLGRAKRLLRLAHDLPSPLRGSLEVGLVVAACPDAWAVLLERLRELHDLYWAAARELFVEVWGERGERTEAQLRAAGLDPALEPWPSIDDV